MSACAYCGNKITSSDESDGKSAGDGASHFICVAEWERRGSEMLCGVCGKVQVTRAGSFCDGCKGRDEYVLKEFYDSLQ